MSIKSLEWCIIQTQKKPINQLHHQSSKQFKLLVVYLSYYFIYSTRLPVIQFRNVILKCTTKMLKLAIRVTA